MEVGLITVGDEVLSGDIVNTNASWLASELTESGVNVTRVLTLPDERGVIASKVKAYSDAVDGVIVTGGIGGTPDDVTMEAVADAFGTTLEPTELTLSSVRSHVASFEKRAPDLDIDVDEEAEAAIPTGSRPLLNEEGLVPGCVIENVYVLPGIPNEMQAMYEQIADEFNGRIQSTFLYTVEPESNIVEALEGAMDRYDVSVGCYPDHDAGHNRLKVTAHDVEEINRAATWLIAEVPASREPISRHEKPDQD